MKIWIHTLLAAACIATLSAQPPQDGQQQQDGVRPPPPPPIVGAVDANHDGTISAEEIANASEALKQLDQDGDGQLSREEFCPPPPRGNGQRRGTSDRSQPN
jgi:hypothetical protein